MAWLQRLRNTFRPERVHGDIRREISFHIAERADQLRSEGLSEEEAARQARLQFGSVTGQAERTRDMDIALWAEALLRNVRYAIRTLARAPGFTATAVLTLALGIGANSAVFSALDAVVLRPLPFPDGDRLMLLSEVREQTSETTIAPVRLEEWNRLNAAFEAITGHYREDVSETSGDLPEKVTQATVAPRFLDVWGVAPALGRGFTAAEHRFGGPRAVLISDRYWRRRFGADPNVLARTIRIESESIEIVGVMPASFLFPDRDVDLWRPVLVDAPYAQHRLSTWFQGIARLRAGVTVEQARDNLAAVQARLAEQYPGTDAGIGVKVVRLKEATVGGLRSSLWLLFGAVTVLLLITCTNIAALLLSRAAQRRQEISIRLSLGATRTAVAAQALTEAAVLALAGAALGWLIATAATAALRSGGMDLPRLDEIALDRRILLYTLLSTAAVAVLCGVLPAIRTARHGLGGALGEAGRAQVSSRNSLQWLLAGAQVALSVTLLAGAGLLVRSFHELSRVNPGFEPSRVLTFRVTASWAETTRMDRLALRLERTIEALQALPGVDAAATSMSLPGVPASHEAMFELVEAQGDDGRRMVAESRSVSPNYFATLQIPLRDGEQCSRQLPGAARDVVVNETFASRYLSAWPSPVGLHLKGDSSKTPAHRIVGIVGDARERGLDHAPGPTVYWCASWNPKPYILVRTRGEPLAVAQAVRLKIKELDPLRSVYDISPLEERIGGAFAENRLRTALLVLFAMTALSLACVGLYGTLSYVVSLRRREIGLRLALGALRRDIVRQFLMQGLRVAGIACVCGLVFSIAWTRALSSMLYGVSASDPITLFSVTAIVLLVSILASLLPAIRGARLDPMRVLRDE
jgi:putative ABC transport system permease protein